MQLSPRLRPKFTIHMQKHLYSKKKMTFYLTTNHPIFFSLGPSRVSFYRKVPEQTLLSSTPSTNAALPNFDPSCISKSAYPTCTRYIIYTIRRKERMPVVFIQYVLIKKIFILKTKTRGLVIFLYLEFTM